MIHIVGCNHGIQMPDIFATEEAVEQRQHWQELLAGIIRESRIEFVGEEWGLENRSIAQDAAQQARIPWANINTSFDDLDAMKIPRDYVSGDHPAEHKAQWHREREVVMMRKLAEQKGDAERMLLICGFEHMNPLAEALEAAGQETQVEDYRTKDWFEQGVFPEE